MPERSRLATTEVFGFEVSHSWTNKSARSRPPTASSVRYPASLRAACVSVEPSSEKKKEGRAFPSSIACRAVTGVCRANLFRSRETTNCLKQELVTRFPGSEVCFLSERVVKGEGVRKLSGLWPDEHRASFPPKSGALTQTSYPV